MVHDNSKSINNMTDLRLKKKHNQKQTNQKQKKTRVQIFTSLLLQSVCSSASHFDSEVQSILFYKVLAAIPASKGCWKSWNNASQALSMMASTQLKLLVVVNIIIISVSRNSLTFI